MKPYNHIKDTGAFRKDKGSFVATTKPIILKVIKYAISRGFFASEDEKDLFQDICLYLLEKHNTILSKFKGRSKLSTYLTAVIINQCFYIARKKTYQKNERFLDSIMGSSNTFQLTKDIIHDEFKKLEAFFTFQRNKKGRLILCLKLLYRIPIESEDIVLAFPGKALMNEDIEDLLDWNMHQSMNVHDKDIFHKITRLLNTYENKDNTQDAVRKWTDAKITDLIVYMNGPAKTSSYQRNTIQILLEKYFIHQKSP